MYPYNSSLPLTASLWAEIQPVLFPPEYRIWCGERMQWRKWFSCLLTRNRELHAFKVRMIVTCSTCWKEKLIYLLTSATEILNLMSKIHSWILNSIASCRKIQFMIQEERLVILYLLVCLCSVDLFIRSSLSLWYVRVKVYFGMFRP